MKRRACLFLSIVIILSVGSLCCYANTADIDTTVTLTLPPKDEFVDGNYLIEVVIDNNVGFSSLQFELTYNEQVLTCTKVVPGDVIKGMLSDSNPKAMGAKTSAILSVAGVNDTILNGTIATFVFEKPLPGEPEIEIVEAEFVSAEGKSLDAVIEINNNYGNSENGSEENNNQDKEHDIPTSDAPIYVPEPEYVPPVILEQPENNTEYVIHDGSENINTPDLSSKNTFIDINENHWAYGYITEANILGIISGYSDSSFRPEHLMTRAEFVTLLWNMNGRPKHETSLPFDDVKADAWYYPQVCWAFGNGYITGTSEFEFSPDGFVTREQAMTLLYRLSEKPAFSCSLESFSDAETVSPYAKDAMTWAVENKIVSGIDAVHLAPTENATRAQLCTIIVRYMKTIKY